MAKNAFHCNSQLCVLRIYVLHTYIYLSGYIFRWTFNVLGKCLKNDQHCLLFDAQSGSNLFKIILYLADIVFKCWHGSETNGATYKVNKIHLLVYNKYSGRVCCLQKEMDGFQLTNRQ